MLPKSMELLQLLEISSYQLNQDQETKTLNQHRDPIWRNVLYYFQEVKFTEIAFNFSLDFYDIA